MNAAMRRGEGDPGPRVAGVGGSHDRYEEQTMHTDVTDGGKSLLFNSADSTSSTQVKNSSLLTASQPEHLGSGKSSNETNNQQSDEKETGEGRNDGNKSEEGDVNMREAEHQDGKPLNESAGRENREHDQIIDLGVELGTTMETGVEDLSKSEVRYLKAMDLKQDPSTEE
ncbi:hypothetical protein Gpo141_00005430 [Globisporangium polare]